MSVGVLDHFNIRTGSSATRSGSTKRSWTSRTATGPISVPGAWMYSEGKPVVHLVDICVPTSNRTRFGVVPCAFASRGFAGMKARLTSRNLPFDVREVPGVEVWQIFVTDPTGDDRTQL